ncbi:hypothetical protein BZA77DRAFT_298967 [Pyronema omphalodes]|nr:hypothetical protein BZA77DRAFT_298967 [Pyronema omphalodes]
MLYLHGFWYLFFFFFSFFLSWIGLHWAGLHWFGFWIIFLGSVCVKHDWKLSFHVYFFFFGPAEIFSYIHTI